MILLRAKDIDFEVTYIDLREKPDWFLEISPHGKVPVLKVDDEILFESNAIAEFLDEMVEPRLHPENPIKRARNRAWTAKTCLGRGGLEEGAQGERGCSHGDQRTPYRSQESEDRSQEKPACSP